MKTENQFSNLSEKEKEKLRKAAQWVVNNSHPDEDNTRALLKKAQKAKDKRDPLSDAW